MLSRKDFTLLAVDAAKSKGLTPVQLQKTLFLLRMKMPQAVPDNFYDFKPYNYGPFDRMVYSDAESLVKEGQVEIRQWPGENWNRYLVTREGEIRASYAAHERAEVADYIARLVEWVQKQTFESLVTAIYAQYPEMRANSVFQG